MSNVKPQFSIISLDAFLKEAGTVKYIFDTITLSEWSVNSLTASYHLSVGLKGTFTDIEDDVSDNENVVFM